MLLDMSRRHISNPTSSVAIEPLEQLCIHNGPLANGQSKLQPALENLHVHASDARDLLLGDVELLRLQRHLTPEDAVSLVRPVPQPCHVGLSRVAVFAPEHRRQRAATEPDFGRHLLLTNLIAG